MTASTCAQDHARSALRSRAYMRREGGREEGFLSAGVRISYAHRILVLLRSIREGILDGGDTCELLVEALLDSIELVLLHEEDARDLQQLLRHRLQDVILRRRAQQAQQSRRKRQVGNKEPTRDR